MTLLILETIVLTVFYISGYKNRYCHLTPACVYSVDNLLNVSLTFISLSFLVMSELSDHSQSPAGILGILFKVWQDHYFCTQVPGPGAGISKSFLFLVLFG